MPPVEVLSPAVIFFILCLSFGDGDKFVCENKIDHKIKRKASFRLQVHYNIITLCLCFCVCI